MSKIRVTQKAPGDGFNAGSNAIHATDSSIVFGHPGCNTKGMRHIVPYLITGMLVAMLAGGVGLVGDAIRKFLHERDLKGPNTQNPSSGPSGHLLPEGERQSAGRSLSRREREARSAG